MNTEQKKNEFPVLVNEAEAAKILGISRVTLWRARKAGLIAFYRVSSSIRYAPEHLSDYLKSRERLTHSDSKNKLAEGNAFT